MFYNENVYLCDLLLTVSFPCPDNVPCTPISLRVPIMILHSVADLLILVFPACIRISVGGNEMSAVHPIR